MGIVEKEKGKKRGGRKEEEKKEERRERGPGEVDGRENTIFSRSFEASSPGQLLWFPRGSLRLVGLEITDRGRGIRGLPRAGQQHLLTCLQLGLLG